MYHSYVTIDRDKACVFLRLVRLNQSDTYRSCSPTGHCCAQEKLSRFAVVLLYG